MLVRSMTATYSDPCHISLPHPSYRPVFALLVGHHRLGSAALGSAELVKMHARRPRTTYSTSHSVRSMYIHSDVRSNYKYKGLACVERMTLSNLSTPPCRLALSTYSVCVLVVPLRWSTVRVQDMRQARLLSCKSHGAPTGTY